MDCTPSGVSLFPSKRKTAAAREMAGALLASTALASSRSGDEGRWRLLAIERADEWVGLFHIYNKIRYLQ